MNMSFIFYQFFGFAIIFIDALINVSSKIQVQREWQTKLNFEKTVAHILKTESIENGNSMIILYHSMSENDENLNYLVNEINKNDIAVTLFSQSMCQRK